jgi:hypothetical protein
MGCSNWQPTRGAKKEVAHRRQDDAPAAGFVEDRSLLVVAG